MAKKILLVISLLLFLSSHTYAASDGVPILMYHSVSEIKNNAAVISAANFKKQMEYLKGNGYTSITFDELNKFLTEKNYKLPKKPIVITFDDGYRDTYTTALPILKKLGLKSSLFLVTSKYEKGIFTKAELKKMQQDGMAIYSHTQTHPSLNKLSSIKQEQEIVNAEKVITGLNGKKAGYFAYPYSHFDNTTINILKKHGYKMAFSSRPGWVKKGDNMFTLKRIYIGNNVSFSSFKERISKSNYKLY